MFNLFKSLFLLSTIFFPIVSFAAGPFDSAIHDGDISMIFLSNLFGSLTPNGGTDAFGDAISTFNQAVLMVGGILATYTILAGTLGTAHEGEALGKKFSSVWIPIRYALGTALVLPVLPSGYCVMQQLVMWCIIQGVGMANLTWNSYLSTDHSKQLPMYKLNQSDIKKLRQFADNVALAQICTQANAALYNGGNSYDILLNKLSYDYRPAYDIDGTVYFGDQGASTVGSKYIWNVKSNCGFATLPTASTFKNNNNSVISPTNGNSSTGKLGNIGEAFKNPDISNIYKIHVEQSKLLIENLGKEAQAAISTDSSMPISSIDTAVDTYVKGIEAAANSYVSSSASPFKDIKEASEEHGWIMAGGWFTKYILLNNSIHKAVSSVPTAEASLRLGSKFRFLDRVSDTIIKVRQEIMKDINTPEIAEEEEQENADSKKSSSSLWSKLIQGIVEVFTSIDLENLQNSNQHPLVVISEAGQQMVSMWSATAMTIMGSAAILGFAGPAFIAIIITVVGFLFIPLTALLGLGLTLGYVLPNLPFLMWIGIVLSWIIMSIEAILAAPLWAVMHLHPNGDDLTGRGGNGYMLLLGLLLRPSLTIFGLIGALTVTELMGEFINKTFFYVISTTQSDGFFSGLSTIVLVIFSLILYTSAMVELMKKTFSLMHVIPDQLMRWIGGSGETMGQYAGGLSGSAEKAGQAGQQTGSFVSDRTTQTGLNVGKSFKDKKDHDKQKAEERNVQQGNADLAAFKEKEALESSQNNALSSVNWLNDDSLKEELNSNNLQASGLSVNSKGELQSNQVQASKDGGDAWSNFNNGKNQATSKAEKFNHAINGAISRLSNNPAALEEFKSSQNIIGKNGESISFSDYQNQNKDKSSIQNTIDFANIKEKQAIENTGGRFVDESNYNNGESYSEKKNNNISTSGNSNNFSNINTANDFNNQSNNTNFSLSDTNAVAADGVTRISTPGGTDASNRPIIVPGGTDASNTGFNSYGNQTPNQSNPDISSSTNIVDNNSNNNFGNEN